MPRNKYPDETVQKILDVSLKLFTEKGFEETTVLDIVDNLGGLTRGAFYHHFKSKEDVLNAISDKLFVDNNPFEIVAADASLNGLEKIRKVFYLQLESSEVQKVNTMALPLLQNPRILVEFLESNQKVVSPSIQKLLEEGMEDGSIRRGNSKLLAELLLLLTNVWQVPSLYPCTANEIAEKIQLIKTVLDSLGVPILDDDIVRNCEKMLS